jgi:hypothetical protein
MLQRATSFSDEDDDDGNHSGDDDDDDMTFDDDDEEDMLIDLTAEIADADLVALALLDSAVLIESEQHSVSSRFSCTMDSSDAGTRTMGRRRRSSRLRRTVLQPHRPPRHQLSSRLNLLPEMVEGEHAADCLNATAAGVVEVVARGDGCVSMLSGDTVEDARGRGRRDAGFGKTDEPRGPTTVPLDFIAEKEPMYY